MQRQNEYKWPTSFFCYWENLVRRFLSLFQVVRIQHAHHWVSICWAPITWNGFRNLHYALLCFCYARLNYGTDDVMHTVTPDCENAQWHSVAMAATNPHVPSPHARLWARGGQAEALWEGSWEVCGGVAYPPHTHFEACGGYGKIFSFCRPKKKKVASFSKPHSI